MIQSRIKRTAPVLLMVIGFTRVVTASELNPVVASWLAAQTNIQTWSAEFVQTRTLKSLAQPLTATGRVWFAAPNRFRWELGHPAQTIAVSATNELVVIYPRLKRAERFALSGEQTGPWRDALALLEAGFPRSKTELENEYVIVSQTVGQERGHLILQPKSAAARRMIPQIEIDFNTRDFSLLGTELEFADGSRMRNDFTNIARNTSIPTAMFDPVFPGDYKLVEPFKNR